MWMCESVSLCVKDPWRMLFSSFVVTNREPVEKGRRDALYRSWPLTSHLSLIDGSSGRTLFPIWRNDQVPAPSLLPSLSLPPSLSFSPKKLLQCWAAACMGSHYGAGTRWKGGPNVFRPGSFSRWWRIPHGVGPSRLDDIPQFGVAVRAGTTCASVNTTPPLRCAMFPH